MTKHKDTLAEKITATDEGMRVWQRERVKFDVTERVCELMGIDGVTRAELASRLNCSRGYVTQLLRGSANLTLEKVSDVYLALGRQFQISDSPISIENDHCPPVISFSYWDEATDENMDDVPVFVKIG